MIKITNKQDCCGCTACASICPKQCIRMKSDVEGFLYPVIDSSRCVDCNACDKVCPVLNNMEAQIPQMCYAAINNEKQVLLKSSSGGMFSVFAEYVLSIGGVVFGARWENDKVIHDRVDSFSTGLSKADFAELISPFRGSKYVQSDLRDTFKQVRQLLRDGRIVLFSGTPCEIGGLISFLGKQHDNLFTIDVACHGAPSPKVLTRYINYLKLQYGEDVSLDFRSKIDGWLDYKVTAYNEQQHFFFENPQMNLYIKGYLHELYSRPSCYNCSFKEFRSHSDITLADFWGIDQVLPTIDSFDGVNLVILNSEKGRKLFFDIQNEITQYEVSLEDALRQNGALIHSENSHPERDYFFKHLDSTELPVLIKKCLSLRKVTRIKLRIKAYLRRICI